MVFSAQRVTLMLTLLGTASALPIHTVNQTALASTDFSERLSSSAVSCQRTVRIRTLLSGPNGYDYLSHDPNTAEWCDIGWPLQTDDPDLYLWHWCSFTTPSGEARVAIRNHKTATWITGADDGGVWCDRQKQDEWETFVVETLPQNDTHVQLKGLSNGRYLGTNCAAGSRGCERGPDLYPVMQAVTPYTYETWLLEEAISTPLGQWEATGTAQSPSDSFECTVTYSEDLTTSSTTTLSASLTVSIEAGFSFMGADAKTSFSGTVASSVSKTVTQALSVKSGFTYKHQCPKEVCNGKKLAKIYQWKMTAAIAGKTSPLSVTTGSFVIFAWSPPKCPPPLCKDTQCQSCT